MPPTPVSAESSPPRHSHPAVWMALGCALFALIVNVWRTSERYTAVDAAARADVVDARLQDLTERLNTCDPSD